MKSYLKPIVFLGLGFAGLVAVANSVLQPTTAVAENRSSTPAGIAQTADSVAAELQTTQAVSPPETIVAQARDSGLAAELQGRPTVVKIYADWCAACQRLRPVTEALQQQFSGRANFVIFDVTDRNTTREAEARARELGLSDFLAAHRAQTSTIAVIDPGSGQVLDQFRYNFNQQDYTNAINEAIAQTALFQQEEELGRLVGLQPK